MAHAQKPDFVFQRNGRVHLNRRGTSVQSATGSRGVHISGSNAGYTMFRDSVKSTGYPLHSSVSPSLPLPCVTVCHHISTELYCFTRNSEELSASVFRVIIIIVIQPLGRSGQRPEFIQATGMALVRCILGEFLGVACHCFPPLFRCSHFSPPGASTSATT